VLLVAEAYSSSSGRLYGILGVAALPTVEGGALDEDAT
jgi:hypothetical protein